MGGGRDGRRRVAITGVGVISPLGDRPAALGEALAAGTCALAPVELFEVGDLRCRLGAEVRGFDAAAYLGDGNLRPLDRTGRLATCAAGLALADGGCDALASGGVEVGLALGTMFGSVRTIAEFDRRAVTAGPIYAQPLVFANSVINAAAGQTAIWHGLRGLNSTVSGGTASGLQALATSTQLLRASGAAVLLAGGADELCFESYFGFYQAGLMAGSANGGEPRPVPFDAGRNGFAAGEGAALLTLEEAGAACRRGARVVAEITGCGMSYDPSRGRDPERAARAVARAIRAALADAELDPEELDAVSASASGSVAGDRAEAFGIAEVFGERRPPVTAVKSMLGEGLGASGALQTVALLEAMTGGVLPGILGLEKVEDGWPQLDWSAEPRELAIRRGLVTAVGDGNACALIVEKG